MKSDWQDKLLVWKLRREKILEKYLNGASMNELAREYKVSPTRIHTILKPLLNTIPKYAETPTSQG